MPSLIPIYHSSFCNLPNTNIKIHPKSNSCPKCALPCSLRPFHSFFLKYFGFQSCIYLCQEDERVLLAIFRDVDFCPSNKGYVSSPLPPTYVLFFRLFFS